jgi:YD repeat-containing protein
VRYAYSGNEFEAGPGNRFYDVPEGAPTEIDLGGGGGTGEQVCFEDPRTGRLLCTGAPADAAPAPVDERQAQGPPATTTEADTNFHTMVYDGHAHVAGSNINWTTIALVVAAALLIAAMLSGKGKG